MHQQKVKLDVLIIVMQSQKENLKFIKIKLQQNTELQQLADYLKNQNKISFKNFIFTTKPAQKGQFTMQKTIKQLSPQCKVRQGAYVLLCYESQVQNTDDHVNEGQSLKSSQTSSKSTAFKESTMSSPNEEKKKKQEDKCNIF